MTDTIEPMAAQIDQQKLAEELVARAREEGVGLVGPGGLLTGLTKSVVETALEEELGERLGYDKHDPAGRNGGNSRNGYRAMTVLTEIGPVEIGVPRDREGCVVPAIVRTRQRRRNGIDEIVVSLTGRGLTTGEVAADFAGVYRAKVGTDTISRITGKVIDEMTEGRNRPLDRVYPVIFIDAIVVKVRDGQVVNRPISVVIGVTVDGERDLLGLWAGDGSEGAKFWLAVFTEINTRGVEDVCIAVGDGLKGLPESITTTWQDATVPACILHLIRSAFGYASRRDWDELARDLRPVYSAPTAEMAGVRVEELADKGGAQYPATINRWRSAWEEFIPFLDYNVEIRRVICSTDENVNPLPLFLLDPFRPRPPQLLGICGSQPRSRWSARLDERP